MKRILIVTLLTLFSFGICITSFAVHDIGQFNQWYINNLPKIDQDHDKNHDKHDKKDKDDHHDKHHDEDKQ